MTSNNSSVSIHRSRTEQTSFEHSTPNDICRCQPLSPIIEHLYETTSSQSENSSNVVLTNDNLNANEFNQALIEKVYNCIKKCNHLQNYLNLLDKNFENVFIIIEYLRKDSNLTAVIESIEANLLKMRVKHKQIGYLLNQSSMGNLIEQILPFINKSKSITDYNDLLISNQLNFNQKTILIDHFNNEYRYRKYKLNEYSTKLKQRRDSIIKLTNKIQLFLIEHNRIIRQDNQIKRVITEHNRQSIELTNLSNEYEQLRNQNSLLIFKINEKIQRVSLLIKSNHY